MVRGASTGTRFPAGRSYGEGGVTRHAAPGGRGPGRRGLRRRPVLAVATAGAVAAVLGVVVTTTASGTNNVVKNSTFDDGLAGWFVGSGTRLALVAGHSGKGAEISHAGPGVKTIVLNDSVNTIASTKAGASYRADAWVRATRPNVSVSLRIMEYGGRTLRGQNKASLWLTDTAWHPVSTTYRAATSGATLDLNVVGNRVPANTGIVIDDVVMSDGTSGGVVTQPSATVTKPPATTKPPVTATATAQPSATKPPATTTTTQAPVTATKPPASTSTSTTTAPAAPAGWRQVWSDEFNGGSLNRSVWKAENYSTYGEGNKELPCLMDRPENLKVAQGVLTLSARRESTPLKCGSSDARFPNGRSYSSAHLSTKGLKDWTYGRFEIRAKLPMTPGKSKGLWPAFWLRPTNGGTGELDVLEAIGSASGGTTSNKVYQTLHYDYVGTHPQVGYEYPLPAGNLGDGWHTFATEWEKGEIRFYVDGKLTITRNKSNTPWIDQAFNKPFYIRLNLAVGGNWPGTPDASTTFPADYVVDYVRVYQR
ncbi:family 16 glycosylhydrolase [Kineosporia sp. J2-2]|uniref:Family 16 glycosylhydrolase n=1 Tax=Kineosporia corallincola TaxID=2835133 RepID=A0ABS5TJI0_9ACTN|nr:family 16 glycosylhydrolase [Kineosporia corallincola]MBT0770549.1 family 16 glycosylhydrolase [Kineosporia corallincola]